MEYPAKYELNVNKSAFYNEPIIEIQDLEERLDTYKSNELRVSRSSHRSVSVTPRSEAKKFFEDLPT